MVLANILDYLTWRGDLSLEAVPFCDVDFLVLCRMSYIPFDSVVSADFLSGSITLGDAAKRVLKLAGQAGDGRLFRLRDDERLLRGLIASERFATLRLCGFVNTFNPANDEQFSAITVLLPQGTAVIAFRGTDGTITGWKEDFSMAFSEAVPAQLDAVRYLEAAAAHFSGGFYLGGHSKGGNLAVYSAAFCTPEVQKRVLRIRNFDGPGFSEKIFQRPQLQNIIGITETILPQSSVIGMLLEHAEDFSIVESRSLGIYQHNVYMWEVVRGGFVTVESLTNSSRFMDVAMKDWIMDMPPELREKMVNGLFQVLENADAKMLSDIWNGKKTFAIMRAYGNLDSETRAVLSEAFRMLKNSIKSSLPTLLQQLGQNIRSDFSPTEFLNNFFSMK